MGSPIAPGDAGAGAGFGLASNSVASDGTPVEKGEQSVASRALALSSYFFSGALCIHLSQLLGTPLYLVNSDWYNAWIAFTKQSFGLLTMTLTQKFAPTTVVMSGDASVRGQILQKTDGTIFLDFPQRLVLIANHQIYTDWLYLWWTAYCSGMHGRLHIILKESLKRIPVIGWGMQLNQFIFLKRNWEKDRPHLAEAMRRLNKLAHPMWLLVFPEGTNLAPSTREKSASWAKKNGIKDMRHCLLPRSTGLRFCLEELKDTVDYVYDCTIAYEGVPRGQYAQDIFTLKAGYLEGRPPKSVSMYWRRYAIKDIPYYNQEVFDLWLTARWREKDLLIENYLIHGHFPSDVGITKTPNQKVKRGCGLLRVPIKSNHWYEFLQIFAPMGTLAMVLYTFYGALPQKMWKAANSQALKSSAKDIDKMKTTQPSSSTNLSLDSFFDKDKQAQTFGNAGIALSQWIQSSEARSMMNRADEIQKWLENPQESIVDTLTRKPEQQVFSELMKEEESRRRQSNSNPHRGTFWEDIETSAKQSMASTNTLQQSIAKKAQTKTSHSANGSDSDQRQSIRAASQNKRTFWDELKAEENSRFGSVASSISAASAINSSPNLRSTTVKQLPITAQKSLVPETSSMIKPGPGKTSKPMSNNLTLTPAKVHSTGKPMKKPAASAPNLPKKSPPVQKISSKPLSQDSVSSGLNRTSAIAEHGLASKVTSKTPPKLPSHLGTKEKASIKKTGPTKVKIATNMNGKSAVALGLKTDRANR